jgi:hypothetical protein
MRVPGDSDSGVARDRDTRAVSFTEGYARREIADLR